LKALAKSENLQQKQLFRSRKQQRRSDVEGLRYQFEPEEGQCRSSERQKRLTKSHVILLSQVGVTQLAREEIQPCRDCIELRGTVSSDAGA